MEIYGQITGINYKPVFCRNLNEYDISQLDRALSKEASFFVNIDNQKLALSWWVSAKRTRSYPYARVYDTLCFSGKKVTVIPVLKDEGIDGDRDFIQWDTISLMSLLGVYVILGFYSRAEKNFSYKNKITNQRFETNYLKNNLKSLLHYQSDALHWNIEQINQIDKILEMAMESYNNISQNLGIKMHSYEDAKRKIKEIYNEKNKFMEKSRDLARLAQEREVKTVQPKEYITGEKAKITIENYLGGQYYFTCDEIDIIGDKLYLIEAKHSKNKILPSEEDIKDALIKMILYTNLRNVKIGERTFNTIPVLKLTTEKEYNEVASLNETLRLLNEEAKQNNFIIKIEKRNI